MTKEEVQHLAALARIGISEEEAKMFQAEITDILSYVGQVSSLITETSTEPQLGARYNVLRADEVKNEPGSYTEAILQNAPDRQGDFLKVKKILQTDV